MYQERICEEDGKSGLFPGKNDLAAALSGQRCEKATTDGGEDVVKDNRRGGGLSAARRVTLLSEVSGQARFACLSRRTLGLRGRQKGTDRRRSCRSAHDHSSRSK